MVQEQEIITCYVTSIPEKVVKPLAAAVKSVLKKFNANEGDGMFSSFLFAINYSQNQFIAANVKKCWKK